MSTRMQLDLLLDWGGSCKQLERVTMMEGAKSIQPQKGFAAGLCTQKGTMKIPNFV